MLVLDNSFLACSRILAGRAQRGLVDDPLSHNTISTQVLPARAASSLMLVADRATANLTDGSRLLVATRTSLSVVPDHPSGRGLENLPVGLPATEHLDGHYRDMQQLD